ncbi:DUF929 family protein [Candidatus Woesearchaeota archaeon]|nr:DUF929 family protein [Candidatus Woesearchaeota archaeon]
MKQMIAILGILAIILSACTSAQQSKPVVQADQSGFLNAAQSIGGFYKIRNDPVLQNDKPVVVFVGAEFCPFCATQRWSVVDALNRFGTFSGLDKASSSGNPDEGSHSGIATYDWTKASYTSDYISFDSKEIADRDGTPLQELTAFEKQFVDRYNAAGSIPFLVVSGKYARTGPAFDPSNLQGKSFDEITAELSEGKTAVAQHVKQDADVIAALICSTTNNQPEKACNEPAVKAHRDQLS